MVKSDGGDVSDRLALLIDDAPFKNRRGFRSANFSERPRCRDSHFLKVIVLEDVGQGGDAARVTESSQFDGSVSPGAEIVAVELLCGEIDRIHGIR